MIWFTSCIGVDFSTNLIPHLLKHYISLGIPEKQFLLILHSRFKGSAGLGRAKTMLREHGIEQKDVWIGEFTSLEKQARVSQILAEFVKPEDWVVHSDADEFHEYAEELVTITKEMDRRGINAVRGPLVDRIATDGTLRGISLDEPIWEQFPIECNVGRKILKLGKSKNIYKKKLLMYRGYLRPSSGSGSIHKQFKGQEKYLRSTYKIHHFKWSADVLKILHRRVHIYKELNMGWWIQSQRFIDYYEKHGRIRLEDVK